MAKRKKRKKPVDHNFVYIFLLAIFVLFVLYFNFDKISNLVKNSQQEKTKVVIKEIHEKISVFDAIVHSKKLLGISDKYFKNRIGDDAIHISLGVDKSEMDLNYANIIIAGQIELVGGKIISGKDKNNSNKQVLEFLDPKDSQKYIVTLYYARRNPDSKKNTLLAIIIDDFGSQNDKLLDDFCNLNPNVNFSILPDLNHSREVMIKAAETGHETMIHIPMEPISYPKNNPGSNAIYVHLSNKEIRKRMERFIKQFPLCVGANNHMGSLATTDEEVMKVVLEVLKKHDLYFIDSRTTHSSVAYDVAKKMMVPTFKSTLFLDTPNMSNKTLNSKINQLKSLSKSRDKLLIITHCATRESYNFLKEFLKMIQKTDFKLVPVSKLFETKLPEIL